MKRFYADAGTRRNDDGSYVICLDDRPVKTQGKKVLSSPSRLLAEAVAEEWRRQAGTIEPESMPLTQLLNTAIDRVIPDRQAFLDGILAYLDTDLVCYRADKPAELQSRQGQIWDPVLEWFCSNIGGRMQTTTELKALSQPAGVRAAMIRILDDMDDYRLTVFQMVTSVSGSVVLALALVEGFMNSSQVFDAIHIEESYKSEIYNEEFYGKAPQQERLETAVRRDLEAGEKFLSLL